MKAYLLNLLVLFTVLVSACSGAFVSEEYEYLPKVKRVDAFVLLHPAFYFRGMKSHDVYERWMMLADELAEKTGVVVIGPDEYRTMTSGMVTDLARETDVAVTLKKFGIDARHAIALRLTLTESWQQLERSVSGRGKSYKGRGSFRSDVEFTADAYHVETSKPLLTAKNSYSGVLPGELRTGDSHPGLTQFATESYDYLLVRLASHFHFPTLPANANVQGLANPLEVEEYQYEKLATLGEELTKKDEIDQDAMRINRILFRYPLIKRGDRRLLQKGLHGVLVKSAAKCSGLRQGDFLVTANGRKVSREYHLNGVRMWFKQGKAVVFELLRDQKRVKVTSSCSGK
jgi:hypothetical protein